MLLQFSKEDGIIFKKKMSSFHLKDWLGNTNEVVNKQGKNINAMKKKYKKLKKQQLEELNQSSSLRKCCFSLMIGKVFWRWEF